MLSAHEANRRYFRQAYGSGRHGWEVEAPSPYAVGFLQRLRKLVPGGRLLDVGCGEGRHAIAGARLGLRVEAVDYEPRALVRARRFARERHIRGIVFRRADVFRLPFPAASFDVILDYGCLHHQRQSDWPAYKSSILRVLGPRGFYLLSVFSPGFRFFRGTGRPWHIARGAYRRCFTRADIEALFGREFELLDVREERGEGRGFWHVLMKRRGP
jgi:SAM-dependent methyltransferase